MVRRRLTPEDSSVNEISYEECEEFLHIERNALGDCLMDQPENYHRVSKAYTLAVGRRDSLKLDIDELTAELDGEIRNTAVEEETKLTETQVQHKIRDNSRMKALQRDLLAAKQDADAWSALKESFQQRSYMLRELVSLELGQRRDLSMEAGSGQASAAYANDIHKRAGAMRRRRRMAQ